MPAVLVAGLSVAAAGAPAQAAVPGAFRDVAPVPGSYPAGRAAETSTVPALKEAPQARRVTGDVTVAVAAAGETRAGILPVTVSPTRSGAATAPAQVRVELLDDATATRAGVDGPLVRLTRADGPGASALSVRVSYAEMRHAFGGAWGDRLRASVLPACALTDPGGKECAPTPLAAVNDHVAGTLTADVSIPLSAAQRPSVLVALSAAADGSGGDYGATDLAPSATWSGGGSSGEFSWSYPMRTPPALNGPGPELSLGYSAGSMDGRTSGSNSQPSWAGDGFDVGSGSIVRSYPGCADVGQPTKGDLCWGGDNATMSLPGHGGELIQDASGKWRLKNDDGTRAEKLTGGGNADNNGEYWKVTTPEGMQYFFGLNRLPGWGEGRPETGSAWTVPVFGDNAGEPCNNADGFHASWCPQAYRWNLDYVVDPHGNTMSYWYSQETNHYARNTTATSVSTYVRGGTLARIDYGTRREASGADSVFTGGANMRVTFGIADRCVTPGATCTLTKANAANWPDVPIDQICDSTTNCLNKYAPSFFSTKRLATVTTSVKKGGSLADVDRWTLNHVFSDPGDANQKLLWLAGLKHEGLVGGTATLPDITFDGVALNNRVDRSSTVDPINRFRLRSVRNEFGGVLTVTYSDVDCVLGSRMPAAPDRNDRRCFPVIWRHAGGATPTLDWFNKYVVTTVTDTDLTGRSPATVTTYQYQGAPAWHYDEAEFVPAARKSWGQWRGYGLVSTLSGAEGQTRSRTDVLYFRGMDGDKLSSGKRSATVTDAAGVALPDSNQLQGMVRESTTYNGTAPVTRTTTDPWQQGPTAKRDRNGVLVEAWATGTRGTTVKTALDGGRGWDTLRTTNRFDYDDALPNPTGRVTAVDDLGDPDSADDDSCTRTSYATDAARNMMSYPAEVETVSVACAVTPDRSRDLVSRVRTFYDGSTTLGELGGPGDATKVDRVTDWNGGDPKYGQVSRTTYDAHGRQLESFDALDRRTATAYTPATGGPVTARTTTNSKGWSATTTLDPAWGLATAESDVNGKRTETAYDALGRLTAVWLPGRARSQTPSAKVSYQIRNGGKPSSVTKAKLNPAGNGYITGYQLYDGLVRPRQTQAPAVGGGAIVADTLYDDRGLVTRRFEPYVVDGAPGDTLFVPTGNVPSATDYEHDGAERVTASVNQVNGVETWRTTTRYGGDRTDVTPPAGGTPTSTYTDPRGRKTELRQFTGGSIGGAFESTTYGYDKAGRTASMTSGGSRWSWAYDLVGNATTTTDPDRGAVTATYDAAGQQRTSTDARGVTVTYDRDELGRKTAVKQGATVLASWTYDTLARGQVTSSTRNDGGTAYTTAVTGYDDAYRATGSTVTVPSGDLAGSYSVSRSFNVDGSPATTELPDKGGLPAETVSYGYNSVGLPTTVTGLDSYLKASTYDRLGRIGRITRTTSTGQSMAEEWGREEGTGRVVAHAAYGDTGVLLDEQYDYDDAGNITTISDRTAQYGAGPDDTQCFRHDGLGRLAEAWTPSDGNCATAPSVARLGGAAPYWQSWTYDAAGNRRTQTDRSTAGTTTQTSAYPAAGAARPHAPSTVTTAGPAGTTTETFGYDDSGNTRSRAGATMEWDAEGNLAKATEAGKATTYVYDADGNRLLERSPDGTTLTTDAGEFHAAPGGPVTATRSYDVGGHLVAVRTTGRGVQWQISDHQATGKVSVATANLAVTKRRTLPFGGPRGAATTWPDRRGFVGGTVDGESVHLGAREYDPDQGRFLTVDPLLAKDDPQQHNGYAYAAWSPVTFSDPAGLTMCPDGDCKANPPPSKQPGGGSAQIKHLGDRTVVVGEKRHSPSGVVVARTTRKYKYYNNNGTVVRQVVGCDETRSVFNNQLTGPASCASSGTVETMGPVTKCSGQNTAGSVCWRGEDGRVYDMDGGVSCLRQGEYGPCSTNVVRPPAPRSCKPTPTPKIGPAPRTPTYIGPAPKAWSVGVCVTGSVGIGPSAGGSVCLVLGSDRAGFQGTTSLGGASPYMWEDGRNPNKNFGLGGGVMPFVSNGNYRDQLGRSRTEASNVLGWSPSYTHAGNVKTLGLTIPFDGANMQLGTSMTVNDTFEIFGWD
jgi:RHS repeat-associated protein